jgi:hypothetical protein
MSGNSCTVTAPQNGGLGNCSSTLQSGAACSFSCNSGYTLIGGPTTCNNGTLTAQTCTAPPSTTDAPIPLWAIVLLAGLLLAIVSRRATERLDGLVTAYAQLGAYVT